MRREELVSGFSVAFDELDDDLPLSTFAFDSSVDDASLSDLLQVRDILELDCLFANLIRGG